MLKTDNIRGYNDLIILSLLINGPSYGYSISKQIKEHTNGGYVIKETTLYSAFNRLNKLGYVTILNDKESKGKTRTYYQITSAGEEYYKQCCKDWKETKKVINKFI